MKRETSWLVIEKIAKQRKTCIRPKYRNHGKAKQDFCAGRVRYYSFPLHKRDRDGNLMYPVRKGTQRGYLRVVPVEHDGKNILILDYISPWSRSDSADALEHFSRRMNRLYQVFIPYDNMPPAIKQKTTPIDGIELDGSQLPSYRAYVSPGKKLATVNPNI